MSSPRILQLTALLALFTTTAFAQAEDPAAQPAPSPSPTPETAAPATPSEPPPPPESTPIEPLTPAQPAAQPPSAAASVAATPEPEVIHRVVLRDGQALRGHVVAENGLEVVLVLAGGGKLRIPRELVREVAVERGAYKTEAGEIWFADANRTRYFYSPSAMLLKKGQAYFSQKELVFSSFAYGVTDNFSIIVGTVLPAWFLGLNGMNGIVGLKAGAPVSEKVHVAAGLETLVLPGFNSGPGGPMPIVAGLLFGSATYGDSDRHLTLNVGKPVGIDVARGNVVSMDLITTLSANYRVHQHVALMTENWLVVNSFAEGQWATAHAIGARFLGEKIAADLGFIWPFLVEGGRVNTTNGIPIPWVDFTYNFDLGGSSASQ